jgi:type I restriction enzyme R subunit
MNKKDLTEQEIRTRYITPAVLDSGWKLADIREEYYFTDGRVELHPRKKPKRGKRNFVDYLLFYKNIPLALIEAKDNHRPLGGGMQQGLRYAETLDVPFVYSSNGDGFVEHDKLQTSGTIERELRLDEFPSPQALWGRYTTGRQLTEEQINIISHPYFSGRDVYQPRYYQRVAIQRTVNAVASGLDRILLVMATGTGKTYTAFQIIWRLWKAQRVQRILFLADRNVLVDQTITGDFKHFGDVMHKIKNRNAEKSFEIYLALYQAVTGNEEDQNIYKQFSPDFFDLIVIDECHRGSAAEDSAWREILTYFSGAIHLGMTATPKETEAVSNSDYFGEPIYTYSLKQGIEDGFLAPYKVVKIDVDKDVDGWMPMPGQTDKYGNVIEDRPYGRKDWDRNIVLEQRNQLVAQRTAEYLETLEPYAKTIVFCVDIAHAERMRRFLVNAIGGEAATERRYVMRITGDNPEGKAELDNFMDVKEPLPVIATTSKLMTTGIDAKMCQVIVLDTVINSMTEFKQIIGRGTRLNFELGKTHFTILDFRGATGLFKDPDFDGDPVQSEDYDGGADEGELFDLTVNFDGDGNGDDDKTERIKYYVDDVEVSVLAERVQYYDPNGVVITKSFTDFSRENVQKQYATLDEFLQNWGENGRKQAILTELMKQGVMIEELLVQEGREYDPFDLICHVAFERPPLTRSERARKVKQDDVYSRFEATARQVLDALLEKYANDGVKALEQAADRKQVRQMLQVNPFDQIGSPQQIVRAFGSIDGYIAAVQKLTDQIYQVS